MSHTVFAVILWKQFLIEQIKLPDLHDKTWDIKPSVQHAGYRPDRLVMPLFVCAHTQTHTKKRPRATLVN